MVGWRLRFLLTICCPAWLADCWDDWRMARTRSLSSSPIDNSVPTPSKVESPTPLSNCQLWKSTSSSSRSEEHTSELQSLMRISYAVFCLKNKHKQIQNYCSLSI